MTKKEFKNRCSFHEFGNGINKRNAIYYDWLSDWENKSFGFKCMVKASVLNLKKDELFNTLYNWVINGEMPNYKVEVKYANEDKDRFKVSLIG